MAEDLTAIRVDQFYPHPPTLVWRALTTPDLMARWLMPNDFRAEPGHRFTFQARPVGATGFSGVIDCEVLEVSPPHRLRISWADAADPERARTEVSWTLHAEGSGTRLLLEHRGFDPDDPTQQLARRIMGGGWRSQIMRRLGDVLDGDQPAVHTVGHGARAVDDLVAVLRAADVTELVDIRRRPGSRRHPQFGREALAAALREAGIGYRWEGEALGGHRSRRPGSRHVALGAHALAGYADHMDTPDFRAAVDTLVAGVGAVRPAVMCAETDWRHCHRMLLADAFTARGARVVHLLAVGRSEAHRPHPTVRRGSDGWPVYDVPDTIPGT